MIKRIWNAIRNNPQIPVLPLLDLSTTEGYNLAAAIRGPDQRDLNEVKWAFTARLRYLAGIRHELCVSVRANPFARDEIENLIFQVSKMGDFHYLFHVCDGARSLGADGLIDAANMLMNNRADNIDRDKLLEALNRD